MQSISKRAYKNDEKQMFCFNHWSKLPEDLTVEILCHLPCKQLTRLKCVSKSWYLIVTRRCAPIISSSSLCGIIYTHRVLDTPHAYLDACHDLKLNLLPGTKFMHGISYLIEQIVHFKPLPVELQDCCKGVFLIARFASIPRQYYVCNPTTHQCIEVPVNSEHCSHNTYNASLVFDPSCTDCPGMFMVVVPREYSKCYLIMDVFSSNFGSWSSHTVPLNSVVDGSQLFVNRSYLYLNGVLYTLSLDKYLVSVFLKSTNNVGNNLFSRATELPGKDKFDCCGMLGVSRGDLLYSNSDGLNIVVWGLGLGGTCWLLRHNISVKELILNPWVNWVIDLQEYLLFVRDYELWAKTDVAAKVVKTDVAAKVVKTDVAAKLVKTNVAAKVYAFHPYSEEIYIATPLQILKYNPRTKQIIELRRLSDLRPVFNMYPVSWCPVILDSVRV